jgi:hypothetical protein
MSYIGKRVFSFVESIGDVPGKIDITGKKESKRGMIRRCGCFERGEGFVLWGDLFFLKGAATSYQEKE